MTREVKTGTKGGFRRTLRLLQGTCFTTSLADALAKEKKADLVTGDPQCKALEKEILVVWLK